MPKAKTSSNITIRRSPEVQEAERIAHAVKSSTSHIIDLALGKALPEVERSLAPLMTKPSRN